MTNQDSLEELERLLKVRLEEWQLRDKNEHPRSKPVLTITQEPDCGAENAAKRLCSELELHFYDWEVVEQIAKDERVSMQVESTLEKHPVSGWLADFLAGLQPEYNLTVAALRACHGGCEEVLLRSCGTVRVSEWSSYWLSYCSRFGW